MKGNCGECECRWYCDIDPNECDAWPDPVPMTNADHIRSMTDEELAEWYGEGMCGGQTVDACREKFHGNCSACALDWLKQPYKEE